MRVTFRVERLEKHNRTDFDCGIEPLNDYLQRQAGQDERRQVTACYLLVENSSGRMTGYYTLSAASVSLGDLPTAIRSKLPRYPTVPVVRVGRLAVAIDFQGQKLGGVLLFDAIKRSATSGIGAFAIVVDAKDDAAANFYKHHGFIKFISQPRILFLPLSASFRKRIGGEETGSPTLPESSAGTSL